MKTKTPFSRPLDRVLPPFDSGVPPFPGKTTTPVESGTTPAPGKATGPRG